MSLTCGDGRCRGGIGLSVGLCVTREIIFYTVRWELLVDFGGTEFQLAACVGI